jgi:hypothetical protein
MGMNSVLLPPGPGPGPGPGPAPPSPSAAASPVAPGPGPGPGVGPASLPLLACPRRAAPRLAICLKCHVCCVELGDLPHLP